MRAGRATLGRAVRLQLAVLLAAATLTTLAAAVAVATAGPAGAVDTWQTQLLPDPVGGGSNFSGADLSCPAAGQCVGVGSYSFGSAPQGMAETLSGGTWAASAISPFEGSTAWQLQAVSCTAVTSCVAVGYYGSGTNNHALADVLSGGSWNAVAGLDPAGAVSAELNGVDCVSATSCVAVGSWTDSEDFSHIVIDTLSGTTWTTTTVPDVVARSNPSIDGVQCTDAADCTAVGYYDTGSDLWAAFSATETAGTWTTRALALPFTANSALLFGLSCPSAGSCVAVGYTIGSSYQPLVEQLSGGSWSVVTPPLTFPASGSVFASVSCVSITDCTYTGYDFSPEQAVAVEDVNGTWWDQSGLGPSAAQGAAGNYAIAVACDPTNTCTIFGTWWNASDALNVWASTAHNGPYFTTDGAAMMFETLNTPYTISATGSAPVTMSETGALPPGIQFTDANSGLDTDTATLSGVPAPYSAGTYDFTVVATDAGGASTDQPFVLTVLPVGNLVPTVTSVSPDIGSGGGGTKVTVTGSRYVHVQQVLFGGTPATSFSVTNQSKLTAVSPGGAAGGFCDITVVTNEGQSATSTADHFTYLAPVITKLSADEGPGLGGTKLTISGTSINNPISVDFGTVPATGPMTWNANDTALTVTIPPHLAALVDVRVTTAGATSAVTSADEYLYDGPTVDMVSPNVGAAGTKVTITGTDFNGTQWVYFGTAPVTQIVSVSASKVVVIAPTHLEGTVDVLLTTPGGSSDSGPDDLFTYTGPRVPL